MSSSLPGGFVVPGSALANTIGAALGLGAAGNGTIPAGAGPSHDALSQLQEAAFRDIPFPCALVGTKGGHRLALHSRMDRDGTFVENLGAKGPTYHLVIPFINGIKASSMESWDTSPLFPDTYLQMLDAVQDRTTGTFTHPFYGDRTCKVGDWSEELSPDARVGVVMQLDLLETVDDDSAVALTSTSAKSIAAQAAADIDAAIPLLNPPPDLGPASPSLSDFIDGITAIGSEISLLEMQVNGKIAQVNAILQGIADTFSTTPGLPDSVMRLIAALHALVAQALAQAKPTSYYVTNTPCTMPQLAVRLGSSAPDLLKLNPSLARTPVLPYGTIVRYYA